MPSCDLRAALGLIAWVAALSAGLSGCGSDTSVPGTHPDGSTDAIDGARSVIDPDGGLGPVPAIDGGAPPTSGTEADFSGVACFNGVDDDNNGITDCYESACSATPFCCLGETSTACCGAPSERLRVTFSSCTGDLARCAPQAIAFGRPAPLLESGAFVPNGATSDSGLLLGEPVDAARERITLVATIAASPGACAECLDAVAFGLGDAVSGDVVNVRADVAVMVRPARRDVALVIAGEVVTSTVLTDADEHTYSLHLDPGGDVELQRDGTMIARSPFLPRSDRRVLLYGRTHNRPFGAPPPARAMEVVVSTSACEMPAALTRPPAPLWPGAGWGTLDTRAPSVEPDGASLLVAFALGPNVHVARVLADGTWSLEGSGDVNLPVLIAPEGEAYRDPELVNAGDHFELYVTHERRGARVIARALGTLGAFSAPVELAAPSGMGLSAPSVVTFGGRWLLAAVVVRSDDPDALEPGEPRIALFAVEGDTLAFWQDDLAGSTVVAARHELHAFDADEVGGPALHVDGAGILRLYYAGRRGSRWSIGLRASGDGIVWPYSSEGPVLVPSGSGHDSLSVLDPSVVTSAGVLQLFHTGTDGLRASIARATGGTRW